MISEPEMADDTGGAPEADGAGATRSARDVVGSASGRRGRLALLVLGTAVVTSAVWGGGIKLVEHGRHRGPDLHGYHMAGSPCAGDALAALGRALGHGPLTALPAETSSGPALDQAQCDLLAAERVEGSWRTGYTVTVTVALHKKTDPGPEFADLNKPKVLATLPPGMLVTSQADIHDTVLPVRGLGDEAYLLVGDRDEVVVTARHGGAVVTVELRAGRRWASKDGLPPADGNGYPQQPPVLDRFRPAVVSAVHDVMAELARK